MYVTKKLSQDLHLIDVSISIESIFLLIGSSLGSSVVEFFLESSVVGSYFRFFSHKGLFIFLKCPQFAFFGMF